MRILPPSTRTRTPAVTVAIVSHNRRALLLEALGTVMAQDLEETIELIIVDNGSNDGSAETVERACPEAQLIRMRRNRGVAVARNRALQVARGPFLAFLDDDDLWETAYLRRQLEALEEERSLLNACAIRLWDVARGRKLYLAQLPDLRRYRSPLHQMLVDNFIVTHSSVVFAQELFRRVGSFDQTLRHGSDADLYTRCLLADIAPTFIPEALATWRVHGDQHTSARHLDWRRQHEPPRYERFAAEIRERNDVPSLRQMRAEADARDARRHLSARQWGPWMRSTLYCSARGFPGLALGNALRQVLGGARQRLDARRDERHGS